MKLRDFLHKDLLNVVAPRAGAWIETCNTLAQWLSYTQDKSELWMGNNITYNSLAGYQSDITGSKYRVVMRVGYIDTNGDSELDYNEYWIDAFDYHWWYQTNENSGWRAQKPGSGASSRVGNSSATTSPQSFSWPATINNHYYSSFYTSDCRYYAVWN